MLHSPILLLKKKLNLLGEITDFAVQSFYGLRKIHKRFGIFIAQVDFIGFQSLSIITWSACFIGAVMAFQSFVVLSRFGMEGFLGTSVGLALSRELAPVVGSIMVAGRAGAAIAAEIATMRVTEQLDAMEALGTEPHNYLVTPRILAGVVSMPLLYGYFLFVGCVSGYFIGTGILGVDGAVYWDSLAWGVDVNDIWQGGVKAAIFGFFLSFMGCFYGYFAGNSAQGVGVATNKAVVVSCLLILFSDYILTAFLPYDPSNLYYQ